MAVPWMKVLDTVGSLVQLTGGGRRSSESVPATGEGEDARPGNPLATIEARLAGVVVAALHEAFDRDRVRMDMERAQVAEEQRRAAEALAAELRRQTAERALGQLRLIAITAVAIWMISAILAAWLPGMRAGIPRFLLGGGWALAFGALGAAFAGWQRISEWSGTSSAAPAALPQTGPASAAPWLLLGSLALIAASLLVAL
jgi:hypothetical protein